MSKIKSFFKYLVGSDVLEYRRKYYQNFKEPEQSLRIKIRNVSDDIFAFGERYIPTLMELDGVRRLFDGQYENGIIELLFAEGIRISEYLKNKRERTSMDSIIRSKNELIEEINKRLEQSAKELEDIIKKN